MLPSKLTAHHTSMQNQAETSLCAEAPNAELSEFENAARYALLQRLIPAIRHNLMSNFQSPMMMSAMLERRLKAANFDLPSIRETCASLSSITRAAAKDSSDLMTWIQPKSSDTVKFDAGVKECLGLVATELRFKGFVIVNEVSSIDVEIFSASLRCLLCAALIALSDLSKAPANLMIRARALLDSVELLIDFQPTDEENPSFARAADSRSLSWREVDILAKAESVKLTRLNHGVQLEFPSAKLDSSDTNVAEKTALHN